MKAVILAGGKGTRISEESKIRPKPMVEIGGKPILWHIMKRYEKYGIKDFIVCCGYKSKVIKKYFLNYYVHNNDMTFHLKNSGNFSQKSHSEPWKVTLVETGTDTLTAGRLLKVKDYLQNETFMLTYGDGVSDINLNSLMNFHKHQNKIVTISTTQPEGRFGALKLDDQSRVRGFKEKAREDQSWVNIGFMVMQPEIFEYLEHGQYMLEGVPFEKLAEAGQMAAYKHYGFWSPMDNIHDRGYLETLWNNGNAPWKS